MRNEALSRIGAVCLAVLVCIANRTAQAQETYFTLIDNTASATLDVAPSTALFQFIKTVNGDTLADAVKAASAFAPDVRAQLQDRGYNASSVEITGPMIPSAQQTIIHLRAKVRMNLVSPGGDVTRGDAFADQCDAMRAMAEALNCGFEGPILEAGDPAALENKAVSSAVENAYGRADAAARVMQLRIVSVDNVSIQEVVWHNQADATATGEPVTVDRVSVTATVRVAYLASPAGSN